MVTTAVTNITSPLSPPDGLVVPSPTDEELKQGYDDWNNSLANDVIPTHNDMIDTINQVVQEINLTEKTVESHREISESVSQETISTIATTTWSAGSYLKGQSVVYSDGNTYEALVNTSTVPTDSDDWSMTSIDIHNLSNAISRIMSPLVEIPMINHILPTRGNGAVTFDRNCTGTRVSNERVLETVPIDEPKMENGMLLSEGTSTNLELDGNNDVGTWDLNGLATATQTVTSVDGTLSAWLISNTDAPTNTTGSNNLRTSPFSLLLGEIATVSAWVRSTNGSQVNLRFASQTTDNQYANTTSQKWVRLSVTTTASIDNYPRPILYSSDGSPFEVCFIQSEKLPFATSYIPTSGTIITRIADKVTLSADGNIGRVDSDKTILIDFFPYQGMSLLGKTLFWVAGFNYNLLRINANNTSLRAYYGGNSDLVSINVYDGEKHRAFYRVKDGIASFGIDGIVTQTSTFTPQIDGVPSKIMIGLNASYLESFYGYLGNFRIYDFALTDDEIRLA